MKVHLLATDTYGHTQTNTDKRPYPLVNTPADKLSESLVCVERAQRAGGKFLSSGVTKVPVMKVYRENKIWGLCSGIWISGVSLAVA